MSVNSKKIGIIYPPPLGIGDQIMSAGSIESIINSNPNSDYFVFTNSPNVLINAKCHYFRYKDLFSFDHLSFSKYYFPCFTKRGSILSFFMRFYAEVHGYLHSFRGKADGFLYNVDFNSPYHHRSALFSRSTSHLCNPRSLLSLAHWSIPSESVCNNKLRENYALIAPWVAWQERRITYNTIAKICRKLNRCNIQPILIGSDSFYEKTYNNTLSKLLNIENFSGLFSLSQLSTLIRQAKLVISCDSGINNIAQLLDTPIISIFGCTTPDSRIFLHMLSHLPMVMPALIIPV